MKTPRLPLLAAAIALGIVSGSVNARAQGVTTAAISGIVRDAANAPMENANVTVVNRSNGRTSIGRTRTDGQYTVQGLEVGGPYSVTVRRLGNEAQTKDSIFIALGQNARVDFVLAARATELAGVTVSVAAEAGGTISRSHTGVGTQISDSTIRRMASPNRDFADFVALTPQVATSGNGTGNGLSAGGMNTRFNTIQIDGANNTDLYAIASGNNSEPGSAAGAKAISIEAVKEYQVLLSPFDVRQGNFSGLLLNAITKSGTNEFHGSTYYYLRNHGLERNAFPNGTNIGKYDQRQYGFTLGGPIMKDRAFFFLSSEWQAERLPSSGPFIGSTDSPILQDQIDLVNGALLPYGIAGGTGDAVSRDQPNTNIFARVDVNLTSNTRLVARYNYADAKKTSFTRSVTGSTPNFPLTSNVFATSNTTKSPVLQLISNFANGVYNEALFSRTDILDFRTVPLTSPQVTVTVPQKPDPATGLPAGNAKIIAGEEASSPGNQIQQSTTEFSDNLTIPFGDHSVTIGGKMQLYRPNNLFANPLRGSWAFNSVTDLQNGLASSYSAAIPVGDTAGNGGAAVADARTASAYIQDQWQATRNLSISAGVRVDVPWINQAPQDNPAVAIEFPGRSTTQIPNKQAQWAPRVGFNWDATGDQLNQVRGGIGVFTGAPPYVFLINAFGNTGVFGFAGVSCLGAAGSATAPPTFNAANIATPPSTCGAGGGTTPSLAAASVINLTNPDFKFPSSYKASVGYDHRFINSRWSFLNGSIGTVEGLFTHAISAPFYQNLALAGPQGTDRFGRTMYGTESATGSTPIFNGATARTGVYDVSSSNKDWSYNLTGTMQHRFSRAFEGSLSYTYSQARDVQSIINSTAASAFNQGRDVSGRHDVQNLARSHWEQPHRVIASGTYTLMKTDFSFIYMGGNGSAYDYVYTGTSTALGDVNADGRSGNDLVYVPKDVYDPNEILFTGYNSSTATASVKAQQDAFNKFINETPCLRNQRGKIMDRNSCRAPWINNTNVAIRHSMPTVMGENASVQLDIFNFANLLNRKWGQNRQVLDGGLTGAFLLSRTGSDITTYGTPTNPQHIYTFTTTTSNYDPNRIESVYRMQISVRYSF